MRYQIGQANRLGNRARNEDRFAAFEGDDAVLLVLADGMGGHTAGEFAAQTLVDVAGELFNAASHPVKEPTKLFTTIVERTHRLIQEFADKYSLAHPPGTTGVLCLLQQGVAQWGHVGDSRLYLFRNHVPLYRTRDHSYVERLVSRGELRRADKTSHPMRNQITQCIGCLAEAPQLEVSKATPLCEGDVILLCSDGFWSPLEDIQMANHLEKSDLDAAVNKLAEEAERGSYPTSDNISVVALRILSLSADRTRERVTEDFETVPRLLQARRPQPEKLQDAIEQIEEMMRKYEQEMKQ